ncbi:MAG: DUF4262 domain-containing protein [Bacteroidota bacterium]
MTDEQREEYFNMVDHNIDTYGFHLTYVLESNETPPFGYSTGLFRHAQLPELFISGLPSGLTHTLIDAYAKLFAQQAVPTRVILDHVSERFPIYLIEVEPKKLEEYMLSSFRIYGDAEFKCLQLIFPDLDGHFPGEQGYDYEQEIFGDILSMPQ